METNQEVLEKIKDFISKIISVNHLYDQFLVSKEKNGEEAAAKDWEKFTLEWKNLTDENNNFFIPSDLNEIGYPNKKAIISSITINAGILKTPIYKDRKYETVQRQLTKATIHYSVTNNQDDSAEGNCFPHFGMYLVLTLGNNSVADGIDNSMSIAIAQTKRGCNLISPDFDLDNGSMSNPSVEVKFNKATDFVDVIMFCEKTFNLINEYLGSQELVRLIEFWPR